MRISTLSLLCFGILITGYMRDDYKLTHPFVTLSHEGQLRGTQFNFQGTDIAVFLGVKFAHADHFKRPKPVKPWNGIMDVQDSNFTCPQIEIFGSKAGQMIGFEDCLYLDITVPGGVHPNAKKAVMVWIHGGGYTIGSGSSYIHTALAKYGDVICVSISYRLGPFGFLSDGPGTGNIGLWD